LVSNAHRFPYVVLAALAWVIAASGTACAQLAAQNVYNGIDRPIPAEVTVPESAGGEVEIHLYEWGGQEPIAQAAAADGAVDLAALFPLLWTEKPSQVLFAQLVVGGTQTGSPLVLQPMQSVNDVVQTQRDGSLLSLSERYEQLSEAGRVEDADAWREYSGVIAFPLRHVELETTAGVIELRMRPDEAPNTVRNFIDLVAGGFYEGIIFHRIIENFVIQVGDPTGTGRGGPGHAIDLEPSDLDHDFGVVSMARSSDPDSGGSQFFICLSRERTAALDGKYAAFGEAVSGRDAIEELAAVETGRNDRPTDPPVLESARVIPAPPIGGAPPRVTPSPPEPVSR